MTETSPGTATPIWVSAIALVNGSRQVLMQQRALGGAHAGLWEFPGGKLEAGESAEAAAVREIAEELGIVIAPDDILPVTFASGHAGAGPPARPLVIMLFLCREWQGVPQPYAAASMAWFDPAELCELAMPPLDYPLAEGLLRFLDDYAI